MSFLWIIQWSSLTYISLKSANEDKFKMKSIKLVELAKTIRSKNAGPDKITFDIIFKDKASYELVKQSSVITSKSIATLYNIPLEKISDFVMYPI